MLNELISKLEFNINCDLNIEELKILYEIDSNIDMSEYRKKRNNFYEDLVKIFGPNLVARTPEEITFNTVCYVGNLNGLNDGLYNLRFLYGDIDYITDNYHMDNIEKIFGGLYLHGDCSNLEELSNLDKVHYMMINKNTNVLSCPGYVHNLSYMDNKINNMSLPKELDNLNLEAIDDENNINGDFPDSLKSLKCLKLKSISDSFITKLPSNLESLEFEVLEEINNKNGALLPETLKLINFSKCSNFNDLKIPDTIEVIKCDSECIEGLNLPINLKQFWGTCLKDTKNIKLNDNLEELYLNNLESVNGLVLPSKLKKLVIKILRNVESYKFPDTLEELTLTTSVFTSYSGLPSNLKKIILLAQKVYNVIFPESVEELRLCNLSTTEGLVLPFNIKILYIDSDLDLSKLVFPEYMETIVLTTKYDRIILDKLDLEELVTNYPVRIPKFFMDLYNGGLRYVDNLYVSGESVYEYFTYLDMITLDSAERRYTIDFKNNKSLIKK